MNSYNPGDPVLLTQGLLVDHPGTYIKFNSSSNTHLCSYIFKERPGEYSFNNEAVKPDFLPAVCEDWS